MLLALVLYGVVVLAIGAFSARSASASPTAYIVGGRRFGGLATSAALASTTIGGSTTLVLAALVSRVGLPGLWLDLAGALGLSALALFLAARVRETGALTISEVIGRVYGPAVRRVAALLTVLAEVVWFALLAQATEIVITAATGWDADRVLVSTAALFIVYTALGGQRAVVGTDVFQLGLMAVALLGIALPLAGRALLASEVPRELLRFPVSAGFSWADVAAMLVLVGLPHTVGGDVWAKLLSARDAGVARRAALFAAGAKLAFGLSTASIALAGVSMGIASGPALFPKTVLALTGPLLAPLLLVAMIATMQSSSDSVLLSAAAATAHDLLPGGSPTVMRLLVVGYGALGLVVALALRDLLETFRLGYTLFASGLILPALLGFTRFRIAPAGAAAAMLAGGAAALVERFLHPLGIDPVLAGTAVNAAVLAGALLLRSGRRSPPRPAVPA